MKYFLVKKNDKFYKIGCSGFTPQGYEESLEIPKELESEHQDDLEIVEELDELGEQLVKRPVLNEAKKAARLQAELEAQDLQKWAIMRQQRDQLLAACDFTQLPDAPLSAELKAAYLVYRQELRDLPENIVDINNFEWPIKP